MTDDDRKKLRELAEWLDRTRTDAGYLFSGERGEASKAWHRAMTTRTVIALLDEIEQSKLHRARSREVVQDLRDQLAAMTKARDEACDLVERMYARTFWTDEESMVREIDELRRVGGDK